MATSAAAGGPEGLTGQLGLELESPAVEAIVRHCRGEAPREACGWLAGSLQLQGGDDGGLPRRGRAWRAYPMRNVAPDPRRRYQMDPAEQFALLRVMRERQEQLVAIYHSHPETPARPSKTDIDLAYTRDAFYLIVSLATAEPDLRAWRLDADTRLSEEVPVRIIPVLEAGTAGLGV